MKLARVAGTVVSTIQVSALDGRKLLLCDLLRLDGTPDGTTVIAVDTVQAGEGEIVLLLDEGGSSAHYRFEAEAVDRQRSTGTARGFGYDFPDYNFDDHIKYFDRDSESLYNLGRIVDGQADDINAAEHSYDRWWDFAQDPEADRTPTAKTPGSSKTGYRE